jgi:hypothetical protein
MGIPIPSITREELEATNGEAGLRLFPFVSGKWTAHTAEVVSVEVMEGKLTDFLVVKGRNGEYGVRIAVQLDPDHISNDYGQDTTKQKERNKDKLLKLLAAFGLAVFKGSRVELDPSRFPKTVGRVFSFSIQGAEDGGRPKMNERGYQVVNTSFKGTVAALLPVVVPDAASPEPSVSSTATNTASAECDDDIPF